MTAAPPSFAKRRPVIRVVLVLVTLLTAWQVFAQFLWIAPTSALRELVPGNFLLSWQIPWFGQSWSVFAPDPINGDYHFKVRAIVKERNEPAHMTQWVDATDAEYELQHHKLLQPRAAALASEQATDYKNAWDDLNDGQKAIVAAGWYEGDGWKGNFESALKRAAGNDEDAQAAAGAFISKNAFTLAYATQAARAVWGNDVVYVQIDIYRQNIVPFEQRHEPGAERPAKQLSPTGWRGTFTLPGQSQREFADVFKPLVEPQLKGNGEDTTGDELPDASPKPSGSPQPSSTPSPVQDDEIEEQH